MKPTLLLAVSVGAIGLVVGVAAVTTHAHTPTVTAECDGLHVSLAKYDGSHGAANTLEVVVDGKATIAHFATTYSNTFEWATTVPHTWTATVTSIAADGGGTWSGRQEPCTGDEVTATSTTNPSPPPSTAQNSTTSTPPSTEGPSVSSAPTTIGPATSTSSAAPDDSSNSTSPTPAPPSNAPRTSTNSTAVSSGRTEGLPATGVGIHDLLWGLALIGAGTIAILASRRRHT